MIKKMRSSVAALLRHFPLLSCFEIWHMQAPVYALITVSLFSHLQAVSIVDSRWDLILLPYRLVFLLLLFSRMGPFCHLIEAHGLGCETAHRGIRRQVAEFPQPLTVPHSIRMHRILTFHNLWVSRLI